LKFSVCLKDNNNKNVILFRDGRKKIIYQRCQSQL